MGTGGLFATSHHSRLRRVRLKNCVFVRFFGHVIREGEASQACVAAAQPNFALPKLQINDVAAKLPLRSWKPLP